MIQIQNVTKSFGVQVLLDGASLLVGDHERVGLVGRNGCGKSTLFKMILGQECLDGGNIDIPKKYTLGYLQQHLNFTHATVHEEACSVLKPNEDGWLEEHKVEAIIVLPRDMFYATDISVTLWIVGNHKKEKTVKRDGKNVKLRNRENEILFIDARQLGDGGANEDGYTLLTEENKRCIAQTLFNWQSPDWKKLYKDEAEFCYSAPMSEVVERDYSLIPSKYIEFIDHDLDIDYKKEMKRIQKEMQDVIVEEVESQEMLV